MTKLTKLTQSSGGEVFVHCHASISRSAVFIIAYLMKHWKMTAVDATRYLNAKP
jgi:protein-tyrosine phosphatase